MARNTNHQSPLRYLFFVVVVLSLLVSLTSLWEHRVLYDQDRLSTIVSDSLTEQSSREAIGEYVADKVFEDRPIAAQLASARLASVVAGLLNTDIADSAIEGLVEQVRITLVTPSNDNVSINISGLKDSILKIQSVIGTSPEERAINAESLPDEIVIIDGNALPDIETINLVVFWLGPVGFTFAFAGLGYWVYRGRKKAMQKRLQISGIVIVTSAAVALLVGPLSQPVFVGLAKDLPGQTILSNVHASLIMPYNQQAYWLLCIGLLLLLFGLFAPRLASLYVQDSTKKKKK